MFKKKLLFLQLIDKNINRKDLINKLNISNSTYYNWKKDYIKKLSLYREYYLL